MNWELMVPDLIKAGITIAGTGAVAFFTARYTVKLALDRFKNERVFDRGLQVLADLVESLSELKRVTRIQHDRAERNAPEHEEYEAKLRDRYWSARRQYEAASANARLMLPAEVILVLDATDNDYARMNSSSAFVTAEEAFYAELTTLNTALEAMIRLGRKSFDKHAANTA